MIDDLIPPQLRDKVHRELDPDERISWIGMPIPTFFTPRSMSLFLFGIVWTAFAIFWTASTAHSTMNASVSIGPFIFFSLFGVPFILIGIRMMLSPIWAYRNALSTVYAITDRRAITIDGGRSLTIRSYPPHEIRDIYRTEQNDGSGDVILARFTYNDSRNHRREEDLGFLRIADPRDVERRLILLAEQCDEPKSR